jgi:Permeases of the major facilitator superfamily
MPNELEREHFDDKEIIMNLYEDKISSLAVIGDTRIIVTESKLKLYLTNHVHKLGKKNSWITPVSLMSGFIIALITCDFKESIFSKDVWKALFIIITIICSLWFIYTLKYIFQPITVDDIITELKKDQINIK